MAVRTLNYPFPCGIPFRTPGAGLYRLGPGVLPLTQVFRDWDFLCIVHGAIRLTHAGGHALVARPGDLAVIPPFVPVNFAEAASPLTYWYCHLGFILPSEPPGADLHAYRGPGRGRRLPAVVRAGTAPAVVDAYVRLASSDPGQPLWDQQPLVCGFITELARIAPAPDASDVETPPVDARVSRLISLVEHDPAHPWSAAGLARMLRLTPGHLNLLMHRHTGLGTKRYLMQARLRSSLRRLRDADAGNSIGDIAMSCGFTSQHLFSRQFRSWFGLTPRAYRLGGTVS